jgi:GT2 family glycosyltransferase
LEVFERERGVGCVGPTTNHAKNHQNSCPPTNHYDIVDFAKTYPGECLGGFCLVFPKSIWEEVYGFPENFGFYGQEVAFLDKITAKGYKQIWRRDAFVWHEGQATVKKLTSEGVFDEVKERAISKQKVVEFRNSLK